MTTVDPTNATPVDPNAVSLTINGKVVSARKGDLIIAAADKSNDFIPRFCYHPRMAPAGMCRQCLVEDPDQLTLRSSPLGSPAVHSVPSAAMAGIGFHPAARAAQAVQFQPHPEPSILLLEPENQAELKLYRECLSREFPEMRLLLAGSQAEAHQLAPAATALLCKAHHVTATLLAGMPRLDWIQALTTGVDAILKLTLPPSVTLTSARGIHGPQMSELALLQMMSLARDFPRMLRNQQQAHWSRWPQRLLLGKTVAIVGIGAVGRELARRCVVFGMRVIGVSDTFTSAENFDEILPRSQLPDVANRADFMILLVPYSADTHHLVDARILQAMKPGSFLINNARGPVVAEQHLLTALQNGPLAGAALDVFTHEPLDPTSPLWQMPNVIITPHIGGLSDCYAEQLMPMLIDNLRSYIAGNPPAHNLVPLQ